VLEHAADPEKLLLVYGAQCCIDGSWQQYSCVPKGTTHDVGMCSAHCDRLRLHMHTRSHCQLWKQLLGITWHQPVTAGRAAGG
jgi:hypothetical protein